MQLLPFYMVCDESGSMAGGGVDAINAALPDLHQEISTNPSVADKTRFALIGFSTQASVLQPLADLSELTQLPSLSAGGFTSFGATFRLLKDTIEKDVAALKADGHDVYRPVVFFLSDGIPTDDGWRTELKELNAFRYAPKIIAFGISDADAATITEVANFKAFLQQNDSISPAVALREFASSLTRSIVSSATSMSAQGGDGFQLQVDEQVPGFTSLSLDKL
ncbi:VWA domain-containing protein [Streptomyces tendae]|uniref:vWA domain-containing protein n=1 Tax=Streptomyces tendae TaxID=1932 RepID=UPI000247672D|nr:von Willebrand factor type A [Streptomyces coelicoflavus ZG0656]MZE44275.1 VWA domain-containing protein [Streptomyces sp. SID5477]